jgi:myo-inositol-1-phosphate synthase
MGKLRVAIVGVGNCASSLVQGVQFYKDARPGDQVPGLMHVELGGYHVRDLEFVAAFDVDAKKVGRDLSEAIHASENNTIRFADVPPLGVEVQRGPTLDGLGAYYAETIQESDQAPVDVAVALAAAGADVLVCYLPVGSEQAARYYAEQALKAGVALVNCLPVFIAGRPEWAERFLQAGVPIIGDDIKSQVGATIVHRVLSRLVEGRGVGDVPLNIELKLEVWDSPNSAGVVIDAVRCAKLALDRGIGGPLLGPAAYFMKSPPVQYTDDVARRMVEEFIAGRSLDAAQA